MKIKDSLKPGPGLFQTGEFTLHSGQKTNFKIDCDALSDSDIASIARMLVDRLAPFGEVEGVPQGGLRLANELRKYALPGVQRKGWYGATSLLIVDDVFTTGMSMEEHRGWRPAQGAVIFAREDTPHWITPLFRMM